MAGLPDPEPAVDRPGRVRIGRGYGRDFWAVFAANFALNGAANMLVIFPLFIVRLGGGAATIGAIAAFGTAMALAVRPALPRAIERMGRRSAVFWALAIEAIALVLYIPIQSLGIPLFAVRALHGAAEGSARVALFATLFNILPAERHGEAMTIFSLNGMMPAAFAPMVGEIIYQRLGFAAFFIVAGALCGCAALAMIAVSDELGAGTGSEAGAAGGARWSELLLSRRLMPIWVATLLFSAAITSRLNFVAPFARQRHVAQIGSYFVAYSAAAIAVRLTCGSLVETVREDLMLAPSLVTLGLGIGLVSQTGGRGMLSIAGIIGGLGHGLTYPALSLMVLRRTPSAAMGQTSAIYTSLFDIAAMAAPYLLGLVAGRAGYAPMFMIAGASAVCAGICVSVAENFFGRSIAEVCDRS